MPRVTSVRKAAVEFIPERADPGVLYVSKRFKTAMHLCCCGCGAEVITPLNPAKWQLVEHGSDVSLFPSVGNWSFPCRSHYWIRKGRVQWAASMNQQQIDFVRRRDEFSANEQFDVKPSRDRGLVRRFSNWLKKLVSDQE